MSVRRGAREGSVGEHGAERGGQAGPEMGPVRGGRRSAGSPGADVMWHDLPREGLPSHGSSLVKQGVGGLSSGANGKLPFPLSFFPHLVC